VKDGQLDAVDRRILTAIAEEGGSSFMRHPSHEHRAYEMSCQGFLKKESAVYAVKSGGRVVEFRNLYTLKPKAKRAMKEGVKAP
jgi:hypothetical protein